MKVSMIKIAIKNSFNLLLIDLFTEIIHRGVMNVVRIIKSIEFRQHQLYNLLSPQSKFYPQQIENQK